MIRMLYILLTAIGMIMPMAVYACTSVIISASASPDGRPMMWKNRDTDFLDNRLEHFKGEKYSFVGLVNSHEGVLGREVWIGSNTAGFSIMNTASYCLKDDDVPSSEMDREGVLMARALEICATLSDFEHFLDTLSRPMGVEANFGCIDALGGAAYYETSNWGYVKRDVSDMEDGYCVVTNFSVTGREKDWRGVERYRTASSVFARQAKSEGRFETMGPHVVMDSLSRSYEHQGDNLYIPRYATSAVVVIQGVKPGESPLNTVMWAAVGYPDSALMIPVPVTEDDHIPAGFKRTPDNVLCEACELSLKVKKDIFPEGSKGPVDFDSANASRGFMQELERGVSDEFIGLFDSYVSGSISYGSYLQKYDQMSVLYIEKIRKAVDSYYDFKKSEK